MNQTIVSIAGKDYTAPATWNDLPLSQLLTSYSVIMKDELRLFELGELVPFKRMQLVQVLFGMDDDMMKLWREECDREYKEHGAVVFFQEMSELLAATDGLFHVEEEEETRTKKYQIALSLTQCPYPTIQTKPQRKWWQLWKKGLVLHAPADQLANLTIYELATVFTLLETFLQSQDEQYLHQLLATIYRPAKEATTENVNNDYNGDIRQPYLRHETTVQQRMPHIEAIPKAVKEILFFWLASCRHRIVEEYQDLFGGDGTDSSNNVGWGGLLLTLANSAKASDLDDVATNNYINVFRYLRLQEYRRQEQERAMKKAKNN
jgi:hypothetical protein